MNAHHVQALPAAQAAVTLPLPAIAALIGAPRPPTAYTAHSWSGASSLGAVHRAGWRARLAPTHAAVTFRRGTGGPTPGWPVADHSAISAAYQAADSLAAVSRRFGRTPPSVAPVLRRAGVPRRGCR